MSISACVCINYPMDILGLTSVDKACKTERLDNITQNADHHKRDGNLQEQAMRHILSGSAFLGGGELQKAYECYDKGLSAYTTLHDKTSIANIYGRLGLILYKQGFFLRAIGMCTKQLASSPKNNRLVCFEAHGLMGDAYTALGMLPDAKHSYNLSLNIATELGDARCIALEHGRQGIVHELSGDMENALVCYNTQLVYSIEARDSYLLGSVYTYMASVFSKMEMNTLAIQYQQKAICVARRIGDISSEGQMLDGLGAIYQYIHQYETAIHFHTQALDIAVRARDNLNEAIACGNLGVAHYRLHDFQKSEEYLKRDLNITIATEDSIGISITSSNLQLMRKGKGDFVIPV
jgi:tetratricopeptide (TPR) repeat protein